MDFYTSTRSSNTTDWITRDEAKAHLRVDFDSDDSYIDALLEASQEACEKILGFQFGTLSHEGFISEFDKVVFFRHPNLTGSPTIRYKDADGNTVSLASSNYKATAKAYPGRVVFNDSLHLSNVNHDPEWLSIAWGASYNTIPKLVKQAGLMIIGHLYEMRQDVGYSRIFEVPMNSKYLLEKYRQQSFV